MIKIKNPFLIRQLIEEIDSSISELEDVAPQLVEETNKAKRGITKYLIELVMIPYSKLINDSLDLIDELEKNGIKVDKGCIEKRKSKKDEIEIAKMKINQIMEPQISNKTTRLMAFISTMKKFEYLKIEMEYFEEGIKKYHLDYPKIRFYQDWEVCPNCKKSKKDFEEGMKLFCSYNCEEEWDNANNK